MSIEEIIKMAHNYGCLYESTLSEVYSEETLLKDLKKQLTLTDVIVSDFCKCDGIQDLYAMTGECRKCGKECDY